MYRKVIIYVILPIKSAYKLILHRQNFNKFVGEARRTPRQLGGIPYLQTPRLVSPQIIFLDTALEHRVYFVSFTRYTYRTADGGLENTVQYTHLFGEVRLSCSL